jgi:peptidoglycan hydrolase-like protein with peptidoglycan-binding domain
LKLLATKLAETLATYYGLKKSSTGASTSTSGNTSNLEPMKLTGPVLRRDSKGAQVKFLQALLKGYGYYSDKLDGSYGPNTETAVCKIQGANNLEADGICGPKTLALLASGNVKVAG